MNDTFDLHFAFMEESTAALLQHRVGLDDSETYYFLNTVRHYKNYRLKKPVEKKLEDYNGYLPSGILSFYITYNPYNPVSPYSINFVISPALLLSGIYYSVDLFTGTPDNIALFYDKFRQIMEELFPIPPGANNYVVYDFAQLRNPDNAVLARIDYSFNFRVADFPPPGKCDLPPEDYNDRLAILYIFLLNAASYPKSGTDRFKYTSTSKRKGYKDNCVRYTSKSVSVIIYDKYEQFNRLYDKVLASDYYDRHLPCCLAIPEALGVLRYEVQFKYPKIKSLKMSLRQLLAEDYALSVLRQYFDKVFFPGDFVNAKVAEERLHDTGMSTKNFNACKEFLAQASKHQSVRGAVTATKSSPATLKSRFNQFASADIQPYRLPVNKRTSFHIPERIEKNGVLPGIEPQLYA